MAIIKTSWEKVKEDNEKDNYSLITPSGFKQQKYDTSIVPGGYLYHRCHLIAWKLGGIDVDKRNLMTGTQSFNVKGMKQFEDEVYNYLKENKTNHVLYRVTPYFDINNALSWEHKYSNPIEITEIIGVFIDNFDSFNISMWICLDKVVYINVTDKNADYLIKYLYERYPY